jgi:hypothetical protein
MQAGTNWPEANSGAQLEITMLFISFKGSDLQNGISANVNAGFNIVTGMK